jgi:predicted  nucleic acid-binding Zn-ribbon protein
MQPMSTGESHDELRAELAVIEREISALRDEIREIRERLAEHADDPGDRVDHVQAQTMAEEEEAVLTVLEARREELRRHLDVERT